jgi:Flp pilus assembly protein TadB
VNGAPALVAVIAPVAVVLVALRLRAWATAPVRLPTMVVAEGRRRGMLAWARPWRRAHPPDDLAVAAWCERVGAGLRSGRSLTAAVIDADAGVDAGAGASGLQPFAEVAHAVRRGHSLAAAFRAVDADPSTPIGLAAPVLATCAELGGAAAAPIESVADVLVGRADERAERLAASAQARLSARVLTTVPVAVAALLAVTEPSVRQAVTTPPGLACICCGAALNSVGWWWMRRMIRGAS